jgi:hypothetical protein
MELTLHQHRYSRTHPNRIGVVSYQSLQVTYT